MSDTDQQLLTRYTTQNAQDAFTELVRRHLDLVFSAALRQVRSFQLAEEIAQSVFTDLSRQARALAPNTVISAWLYQVTRRTAIDVIRRESRRQLREQIATHMQAINAPSEDWNHIEPVLDEAMQELDDSDRAAVLLRYFENKSLRDVGLALGATEEAARKRVNRAVDRLREIFIRRGLTVGASTLSAVISTNAVHAAPASLIAVISTNTVVVGSSALSAAAATTAKTGAALKLATATAAGGWLALFAGTFISNKAQADETKSPRERRFMLQVMAIRLVIALVTLLTFYGWLKPNFIHASLAHEITFASYLFVYAAATTLFFAYIRRRQWQIQTEDGTWRAAEWTRPRKETEKVSADNEQPNKQRPPRNTFAFRAPAAVLLVLFAFKAPWIQHPDMALLFMGFMLLCVLWSHRRFQNRPRFLPVPFHGLLGMLSVCVITLFNFNLHPHSTLATAAIISPAATLSFNLLVIFAYCAFTVIFLWKRQHILEPSHRA